MFDKELDNGGERIKLVDAGGGVTHEFTYDDVWFINTDGGNKTLANINPNAGPENLHLLSSWRESLDVGGSPGRANQLLGDANGDRNVSLLDLDILGWNFGNQSGTATAGQGDLNGDGNVGLADLDVLGRQFGNSQMLQIPSGDINNLSPGLLALDFIEQHSAQQPIFFVATNTSPLASLLDDSNEQNIDLLAGIN